MMRIGSRTSAWGFPASVRAAYFGAGLASGASRWAGTTGGGNARGLPKTAAQRRREHEAAAERNERGAYSSSAANPFSNWDRVRHWHMLLMCGGCLLGGIAAGRFVDVDEDLIRKQIVAPFDRNEIEAAFQQAFELRPDLAATMLRYALVDVCQRAEASGRLPPVCPANSPVSSATAFDACRSTRGLNDVLSQINFHTTTREISRGDAAALGVIAAIRFLRGPADKIWFRWGRVDPEVRAEAEKNESFLTKALRAPTEPQDKHISSGSSDGLLFARNLVKAVPNLNFEEAVALMAAHCVGEFHEDVSGVSSENANRVSRHKYFLSVHYYQLLFDLVNNNQLTPAEIRQDRSLALPTPPVIERAVAEMAHPVTGKKIKRTALITKDEVDGLGRDREAVEVVTSFASDAQWWQESFAAGMTKLLDAHYPGLKQYVSEAEARAEKRKRQAELDDVPSPALTREKKGP